jgi:hypothetical protein
MEVTFCHNNNRWMEMNPSIFNFLINFSNLNFCKNKMNYEEEWMWNKAMIVRKGVMCHHLHEPKRQYDAIIKKTMAHANHFNKFFSFAAFFQVIV